MGLARKEVQKAANEWFSAYGFVYFLFLGLFGGIFFSFPTENLSWVLLQKTIPLSLLFVPPQGPQQLLTNVFLSPSENAEIVGSLTWLTCLSHKAVRVSLNSQSLIQLPLCVKAASTGLNTIYIIKIQFLVKIIIEGKYYCYPLDFTDEEMAAQRGRIIKSRIKLRLSGSRVDAQ